MGLLKSQYEQERKWIFEYMSDLGVREVINSLNNKDIIDWGLSAINAPKMWNKTKGEGVKIAVIDTGIDMSHPDIRNVKGSINMFEKSLDVTDEYGHGTHVAGLIGGRYTGVAPEAELYIAKVLNSDGFGSIASVMDGITFAINYNVDIICMSLGVHKNLPIILRERIAKAYHSGITIVCATGNNGMNEPDYPAFMDEVIAVGGVDKNLNVTNFSNRGKQVDIVAPAVEILSTWKDNNYAKLTGTSMASPLVAGAVALIISYHREQGIELKSYDIKRMISELGEHSYDYGYGIMDLTKFMD